MSVKIRRVKDSMGFVSIPDNALYGAQTQRAIDNFNFTTRAMPEAFIKMLAQIKKSAARANLKLQCIEPQQARYIIKAATQVINQDYYSHFPVNVFQTGSGTSTNMNMNEVLANLGIRLANNDGIKIQIHPNNQVNCSQSSNDVIPACIQLSSMYAVVHELIPAIDKLLICLSRLSLENQNVIKTGRTHLMDAMPLTLGDEFKTWQFQIEEAKTSLLESLLQLCEVPLGGTAIGTGINAPAEFSALICGYLSEDLGIQILPVANPAARMSGLDVALDLHSQFKRIASVYVKLSNDLRWMNSGPVCGLNELQLNPLQPGSSIMPGKVNPVIPEAIIMMATEVIGNDTCITLANQAGNFQLNVMMPLVADKLLGSIQLLTDASNAFADKALSGFQVNRALLAEKSAANPILITALNTVIGYDKAAEIAKNAYQTKRSILAVASAMTDLSQTELESLLALEKLAKPHGKN